jgi:hypothetical protein
VSGIDLLALAVPALIVLLGAYVFYQARRSRESELSYNLRKCKIALDDAEQALENTVSYYKAEIGRLKGRLGETVADEAPDGRGANGRDHGFAPDAKFKQARTAFARMYHPDGVRGDPDEKRIRAELFKEFWDELDRIDRRNP